MMADDLQARDSATMAMPGVQNDGPPLDTLELYRWAVQDPETHAEVLRIMYEWYNPACHPTTLREDFAGTAADSVAWVAIRPGRRAVAVDIDFDTTEWAKRRAERILGDRARLIDFVAQDAMEARPPDVQVADILCILNFSIFYFHQEENLAAYLSHAAKCLLPGGILVLNLFGGSDALRPHMDERHITPAPRLPTELPIPPFDYVWEQWSYNEETGRLDCGIHFRVPSPAGYPHHREVRDAFTYDWKVRSPGALMSLLRNAGFDTVEMWRHTYDEVKGPESLFLGPVPESEVESLNHWTAYIAAVAPISERPAYRHCPPP